METTPDFAVLFVKMLAGLILVLILAVVLIRYLLPRSRLSFLKGGKKSDWVSVLNRFPLEPRKTLYLVKVASRYFLLGSAENSLNLVGELNETDMQKIQATD